MLANRERQRVAAIVNDMNEVNIDAGWRARGSWPVPWAGTKRVGVMKLVQGKWGDRRQKVASIGVDVDKASSRARLDACLLTHGKMRGGPVPWSHLPDPFPQWGQEP